jgi:hypothetical protein
MKAHSQSATLQACFGVAEGIDDILTEEVWATRRHAPQVNVGCGFTSGGSATPVTRPWHLAV